MGGSWLIPTKSTASGRVTRRASSGPGCFLRENALGLASREFSPGKPLPSTAEWPGSGCLQRPQRGLPHVDGPLGGAFLIPRPMAVVGYFRRVGAAFADFDQSIQ